MGKIRCSNCKNASSEQIMETTRKILRRESHSEEKKSVITPAAIQLLPKMRSKSKSNALSDNNAGKSAKSISVRFKKFLNATLKLKVKFAQHIIEIRKSKRKNFLFSSVRNYIQDNAGLLSFFY